MERTTPSTHTPATTTTTKKNIFRFFDLPRELRDDIYSRLSPRHARVKGKRCGLTFVRELRFPHFPVLDLLLVSRKFEFEYEEAIARDPRSKELVVDVDLKPVTKVWGATPNSLLDRLYPIERVEVRQNRRAMIEMWEASQWGANEDMQKLLPLMPSLKHFTSALSFKADIFERLVVLSGMTKASYEAEAIAEWLLDGAQGRNMLALQLHTVILIRTTLFRIKRIHRTDVEYRKWMVGQLREAGHFSPEGRSWTRSVNEHPKNEITLMGRPEVGSHTS